MGRPWVPAFPQSSQREPAHRRTGPVPARRRSVRRPPRPTSRPRARRAVARSTPRLRRRPRRRPPRGRARWPPADRDRRAHRATAPAPACGGRPQPGREAARRLIGRRPDPACDPPSRREPGRPEPQARQAGSSACRAASPPCPPPTEAATPRSGQTNPHRRPARPTTPVRERGTVARGERWSRFGPRLDARSGAALDRPTAETCGWPNPDVDNYARPPHRPPKPSVHTGILEIGGRPKARSDRPAHRRGMIRRLARERPYPAASAPNC
jgi:hypothetical protein